MALKSQSRSSSAQKPTKSAVCDDIERVGQELVESFKLIEEAWGKAEAKLAHSHVPIDVRVKVDEGSFDPDSSGDGYVSYLGYVKLKNVWRICFITESYYFDNAGEERTEYSCRPITECPVETRLEMFDQFTKLYEEVVKVSKSFVPKIRDSVSRFETTLNLVDL